jgi:hypothetical protein
VRQEQRGPAARARPERAALRVQAQQERVLQERVLQELPVRPRPEYRL